MAVFILVLAVFDEDTDVAGILNCSQSIHDEQRLTSSREVQSWNATNVLFPTHRSRLDGSAILCRIRIIELWSLEGSKWTSNFQQSLSPGECWYTSWVFLSSWRWRFRRQGLWMPWSSQLPPKVGTMARKVLAMRTPVMPLAGPRTPMTTQVR